MSMPTTVNSIDFMQLLRDYNIVTVDLYDQPTNNNIFTKLGKATGRLSNFFTKPETKVLSIFTYWAVESVVFSIIIFTTTSYAILFSSLFLYAYGTYAIFSAINSLLK